MSHFIDQFFNMTIDNYKSYLEKLSPIEVKNIHDAYRGYIPRTLNRYGELHPKCRDFQKITKEVLETKGHIPNKNERKANRKAKQLEKQNR